MEVQMTSNMDTVLDVAPYNNHTVKCAVSHESFARIRGTLVYSFFSNDSILHKEFLSISTPGPFTTFSIVSENVTGMIDHICNVTLVVASKGVDSRVNGTTVEVLGKCHIMSSTLHWCYFCPWHRSKTSGSPWIIKFHYFNHLYYCQLDCS